MLLKMDDRVVNRKPAPATLNRKYLKPSRSASGVPSCAMAKYRAHELMISQKVKKLNRSELAATPSSPPVMSRKKA